MKKNKQSRNQEDLARLLQRMDQIPTTEEATVNVRDLVMFIMSMHWKFHELHSRKDTYTKNIGFPTDGRQDLSFPRFDTARMNEDGLVKRQISDRCVSDCQGWC